MKYRNFNERKFNGRNLTSMGEINGKYRVTTANVRVVPNFASVHLFLSIDSVDTSVCVEQLALDLSGPQRSGLWQWCAPYLK